jgi:hypothetical protein
MALIMRKFLALLGGFGLGASVVAYLGSFRGMTFTSLVPWAIVLLHGGVFLLTVLMMVIEYSSFTYNSPPWIWFSGGRPIERGSFSWKGYSAGAPHWDESFFWKGYCRGMPKWILPTIKLLGLFFFFQFIVLLVRDDAAKSAELRMFAAAWTLFYFVSTAYWWFPRNRQA